MDRLYQLLQNRIQGAVATPDEFHPAQLTNFGNLFHATPRLVVSPASAKDVASTVAFARENRLSISTRGSGHSQSFLAISDGGILLDMPSLGRIGKVDREALTVDVEGGTV